MIGGIYLKCVNKPSFTSSKIIDKNFVAVHCSKKVLCLNKPIYVGFCILELSKLLMYKFHYDYVLKTLNDAKLLFTDTDSLVYEIKGGNVYEQCFKDKHLFHFSGYSKYSVYYDHFNKKKLAKMKDEFNGVKIDEFVGLKSKMYSLKRIQSDLHEIGTYDINKISLICFGDKRYVLDDGINTLAYGHKDMLIKLGEIKLLLIRNIRVVKLLIRSIIFDENSKVVKLLIRSNWVFKLC